MIPVGKGELVGWDLGRLNKVTPEKTLRGMMLSLVYRTIGEYAPGPTLLGQHLEYHDCSRGELLRDQLLLHEEQPPIAEIERLALKLAGENPDAATLAFCQTVTVAASVWRRLIREPALKAADVIVHGATPDAKPVTGVELRDSGDEKNWNKPEWDTYLSCDIPVELIPHLYLASEKLVDARLWHQACVDEGKADEIADARSKLDKKLSTWRITCTKVQAVAVGARKTDGERWVWPCRGARIGTLEAQVRRRMDEARLAKKEAEEGANNGLKKLPKNEHGELVC